MSRWSRTTRTHRVGPEMARVSARDPRVSRSARSLGPPTPSTGEGELSPAKSAIVRGGMVITTSALISSDLLGVGEPSGTSEELRMIRGAESLACVDPRYVPIRSGRIGRRSGRGVGAHALHVQLSPTQRSPGRPVAVAVTCRRPRGQGLSVREGCKSPYLRGNQ